MNCKTPGRAVGGKQSALHFPLETARISSRPSAPYLHSLTALCGICSQNRLANAEFITGEKDLRKLLKNIRRELSAKPRRSTKTTTATTTAKKPVKRQRKKLPQRLAGEKEVPGGRKERLPTRQIVKFIRVAMDKRRRKLRMQSMSTQTGLGLNSHLGEAIFVEGIESKDGAKDEGIRDTINRFGMYDITSMSDALILRRNFNESCMVEFAHALDSL